MQPLPAAEMSQQSSAPFGALSMDVAWESSWRQFRSSVRSFVREPRPPKTGPFTGGPWLCIHWVEGRLPARAFTASAAWHVAAIWLMILPIWGFLPKPEHTLPTVQFELTYDPKTLDLPHISLPARVPKPKAAVAKPEEAPKPVEERGADAYHPRQTILSIPVKITHPRQTLIQPSAPVEPPKIAPQMPNIVEWAAAAPVPKPQMRLAPAAATAQVRHREVHDVAAPDIANQEKNPDALNIAASPTVNPAPRLAMNPSVAPVQQRRANTQTAAPEIASTASDGDASQHRLIALSTDPAPPAPVAEVPRGNLAAKIAISPEGTKPGTSTGASHASGSATTPSGAGASNGNNSAAVSGSSSLPAAVSVSGGSAARPGGKLNLNPSLPAHPDSHYALRTGPSVTGTIDPSVAPDKILSGKEVYTMHIDMPNLTSSTGSWLVNFAELNEEASAAAHGKGRLGAPVLEHKADPAYPSSAIKQHIEGQVILYAIIRKDGTVDSIQRVRGLDPELDKNAVAALAQWKFQPAMRDGEAVDIEAVVYIPFRYHAPLE